MMYGDKNCGSKHLWHLSSAFDNQITPCYTPTQAEAPLLALKLTQKGKSADTGTTRVQDVLRMIMIVGLCPLIFLSRTRLAAYC